MGSARSLWAAPRRSATSQTSWDIGVSKALELLGFACEERSSADGAPLPLEDLRRALASVLAAAADPVFQRARAVDVPVQLLQRMAQHPAIGQVADRFRDVRAVVDHLRHPDASEAPAYPSSSAFFSPAERPNVYVKVTMHNVHSREAYPWADLHGYQQRVFDAFGPHRLMWGFVAP